VEDRPAIENWEDQLERYELGEFDSACFKAGRGSAAAATLPFRADFIRVWLLSFPASTTIADVVGWRLFGPIRCTVAKTCTLLIDRREKTGMLHNPRLEILLKQGPGT
jgi:hypothetical protein